VSPTVNAPASGEPDPRDTVIRALVEALNAAKADGDAYRAIANEAVAYAGELARQLEMTDERQATYRRHVLEPREAA
jgi:hypothetical protein